VELTRVFKDFDARVCCHECDHLNGIMFFDKKVPDVETEEE
jgi:peptide deformylase